VSLDDGGALIVTLGDDEILAHGGAAESDPSGLSGLSGLSGDRVLIGLRPSAIAIHTTRPTHASPRNVWEGKVASLELLADRVRVQVDATPPALVDVSAAAVQDLALRPGTGVWLSAKANETEAYRNPGTHPRS